MDIKDIKIVVYNKIDAELFINWVERMINTYGALSVSDMKYEITERFCLLTDPKYTETKYGWTDAKDFDVIRRRGGYEIYIPEAKAI